MKKIILSKNEKTIHKNFILRTNSLKFKIEYNIKHSPKGNFPHIGIGAREGLCILYRINTEKYWRNLDIYVRSTEISIDLSNKIPKDVFFDILIYCPILTNLTKLSITIPKEYQIEQLHENKDMLIAGGIHSYGVGCTTSSLLFSNIFARMKGYNINNISVYDNNFLEKIYSNLNDINGPYDLGILELDFVNQKTELVNSYLEDTILNMKSKCKILICWFSIPSFLDKYTNILNIIENFQDKQIIFVDMSCLYNEKYRTIATSSINFLNDTSNIYIYKKISKILGENYGIY